MSDDSEKTMMWAFAALFIWLGAQFSEGFVAMNLWRWFVVPVTGWPPLGYWTAMGLALLAALWAHQIPLGVNAESSENTSKRAFTGFWHVWFVFGLGWAFHWGVR